MKNILIFIITLVSILLSVFLPSFYYAGPQFIILLILLSIHSKVERAFLSIVFWNIVTAIILVLFSFIFASNGSNWDIVRDILYLFKVSIGLLIGIHLYYMKIDISLITKIIVWGALIYVSIYFSSILIYIAKGGEILNLRPQLFRLEFGFGELIVPFAFIFAYSFGNKVFHKFRFTVLLILLIQVLLSQSRTALIILLVFSILTVNNKANVVSKFLIMFSLYVCIFIIVLVSAFSGMSLDIQANHDSYFAKLLFSIFEVIPKDYSSKSDVANHWRGFETFHALNYIANAAPMNIIFGFGAGARLPLPITMTLAGNDYDSIQFLHNGYLMIMLKSGLVGLFAYLYLCFKFYRKALILPKRFIELAVIQKSMFWFLILSTSLMAGPFDADDYGGIIILYGYVFALTKNITSNKMKF